MKNKEQISFIMSQFDFEKIHSVMKFLKWKWKFSNNEFRVPNIEELKIAAINCLNKVATSHDEVDHFSIGGFEADKINNVLELRFILDKSNPLSQMLHTKL